MKIVFFGSAHFGLPSLKALLASGHKVTCVITQPDRKKGRGMHLASTLIKTVAQGLAIRTFQPLDINTQESVSLLKELEPDLFVVIAYGQILSQEVLDIPKVMAINVHASYLPKYRGAAPINWTIINGDSTAGITVIKLVRKMDAGPIISQKEFAVGKSDTAETLEKRLSEIAPQLLIDAVNSIQNNDYKLVAQEQLKVSFAPKLKKKDGLIIWDKPSREINNLINGCLSWPGAYTFYKGKMLKIFKARAEELTCAHDPHSCGRVVRISKEGIVVADASQGLVIEELQIEGGRKMTAAEFIAGHKISVGDKLGIKN